MTQTYTAHDVRAIPVGRLFDDPTERYSVPLYQRNYTWGEEQIHRLVQDVLAEKGAVTKSGLMLGLGESDDEVLQTLHDLRDAGVRIVTLGQYLRPTLEHYPVAAYITPEKFEWYRLRALEMGFSYCASAPLVRSSYMAEEALRSVRSTAPENAGSR